MQNFVQPGFRQKTADLSGVTMSKKKHDVVARDSTLPISSKRLGACSGTAPKMMHCPVLGSPFTAALVSSPFQKAKTIRLAPLHMTSQYNNSHPQHNFSHQPGRLEPQGFQTTPRLHKKLSPLHNNLHPSAQIRSPTAQLSSPYDGKPA